MTCWSCGAPTRSFFELNAVPSGSCVLLRSRADAVAYPTGDLDLAHCEACGLVQNAAFDEDLVDYTSGYEASQSYSPVFRAFAERLVDDLVETYGLRGKTVLEPGCGQGEFLELFTSRSGGTGIGLDPAYQSGRSASANVEIRPEPLTIESAVTADAIVCRHTLEHIRDLDGFMAATVAAARRTPGAVVAFEIPDSLRILEEGAFWDVYYEHSTYFTMGSIARLFRRHELAPRRVRLDFDDQYILIDAQIGSGQPLEAEHDLDRTSEAVRGFAGLVPARISEWQRIVAGAERPVVWGASSKAVGFMAAVPGITLAVDINPYKRGSYLAGSGVGVVGPDDLSAHDPDLVVVMNPIYEQEIGQILRERGIDAEVRSLR